VSGPSGALRVLGLDPGTRHFGWGLAERVGVRLRHVAHGVISPGEALPLGERLVRIEEGLIEVLSAHAPNECAIESLFFARDPSAAAKLGHARGVALLVCARAGLPTGEYPPARVKSTVAGGGRAEKDQVAQMVRLILSLPALPPADAADALAVALTHLQRAPLAARLGPPARPAPRPRRQASLRAK
jgi:crossover junction endodeoxyribonuclease RuvC